ncbi:protein-(glutamine-N5) methyltransferase, release factor-specific [Hoeflea sp. IMCC20628]|uniref:peptide chain release factor N(5)-glutamine methyltransferase n=1 Tax=Hoeflea sp. IMCC20628 TaxID=1620421 RepID=UPI00063BF6A2|nr:peptide chain release factor N(5)-glutamine methyltransferase [Hoeflea sp. IMCC20628]AKI03280.1 protein-(glutamine-N5) methyltransferase, release factor-specific [Hoeflea sp. IMCC20628]
MIKPDLSGATTIGDAWLMVRTAFRSADLETADLDARLLTAGIANIGPHRLVTGGEARLQDGVRDRLAQAVWDRLNGMPVHRILGAREFYGLKLGLSAATLEPRPDTECLVDAVLPFVRSTCAEKGSCSIVDLGIGTGAIGLALLAECTAAHCLGVDVSAPAVATALENARVLGLSGRYSAVVGDWFSGMEERFDLIVSNPPYIPTSDLASLKREVTDHDPMLALDGGPDGLAAYRVIAAQAAGRLEDDGMVAIEIGIGQRASVSALFNLAGFEEGTVYSDLGGVDRVLCFTLSGSANMASTDFRG